MKIHLLGTGTSVGVPLFGCNCTVCSSADVKNKRLRSSAFIDLDNDEVPRGLLIDTSPDLRQQMLRLGTRKLEAVFYTHFHADHVNGIDDLRPFNFVQREHIPVFSDEFAAKQLRNSFSYAFTSASTLEGGTPPRLESKVIRGGEPFEVAGVSLLPIAIEHGRQQILGVRIKDVAYLTDCSSIPDESIAHLQGLELLVLSALRHRPHPNHLTVQAAVEWVEKLKPKWTLLTHISHELEHEATNKLLKELSSRNISLAYDGLSVEF